MRGTRAHGSSARNDRRLTRQTERTIQGVRLVFEPVVRGRRHLVLRYGVGDLRFSTTYWYDDVEFFEIEERYGEDALRKLYFHVLAFEANKAGSLAPTQVDAGSYADLVTDSFWDLWETLFRNVWAVWRFENN